MDLTQYLNKNKAQPVPLEIDGTPVQGVYLRRLNAGEGLQLKEAYADMIDLVGDAVAKVAGEGDDAEKLDETIRKRLDPEQLRALFRFQALFTFLHLADKNGSRVYSEREAFDDEMTDEFVSAYYNAASKVKNRVEDNAQDAEKN